MQLYFSLSPSPLELNIFKRIYVAAECTAEYLLREHDKCIPKRRKKQLSNNLLVQTRIYLESLMQVQILFSFYLTKKNHSNFVSQNREQNATFNFLPFPLLPTIFCSYCDYTLKPNQINFNLNFISDNFFCPVYNLNSINFSLMEIAEIGKHVRDFIHKQ